MGRFRKDSTVLDAPFDLTAEVTACDLAGAEAQAPTNCVAARAIERVCPGAQVSFGASLAYIQMPGDTVVRRYVLSAPARASILEFDKTGAFPLGPITLLAPTNTRRLGYHPKSRDTKAHGTRAGGRYTTPRRQPLRVAARPGTPTR